MLGEEGSLDSWSVVEIMTHDYGTDWLHLLRFERLIPLEALFFY